MIITNENIHKSRTMIFLKELINKKILSETELAKLVIDGNIYKLNEIYHRLVSNGFKIRRKIYEPTFQERRRAKIGRPNSKNRVVIYYIE